MKEIKTLSEFIDWASQFKDQECLFRGVPNATFEIQASACRRLPKEDEDNSGQLLKINQELIKEARTLGHDLKNGQPLSDLELLAELQHFGAATCLIDFSRSALNALWFACQKNPKKEEGEANGKVFAVPCDAVSRLRTVTPQLIKENIDYFFKQDENERYLYQWTPKLQNNRIIAQHSVFLFGGAQIEVAEECVIMQSSKPEILKSLAEVSDITEATMYPDFDGFARLHVHDKPYVEPDAQGLLNLGVAAHQNGNLPDAIDYYHRAIERDPNNANAYTYRGYAYNRKGEYDNAIGDFNRAIELNPNNANVYTYRGIAYNRKGEYGKAIGDFNRAIKRDPNYAYAYAMRGSAYNSKGEYDKTIGDFSRAIELNPNYAYAYYSRGSAYNSKGEYDNAFEDFNRAIERDPNYAYAYYSRGVAYKRKGEYANAIEDLNRAIELNLNNANAYYTRGIAWLHLGGWQNAISDLTTAEHMGGMSIITRFQWEHGSVSDFEQKYCIQLPRDITTLLTTP